MTDKRNSFLFEHSGMLQSDRLGLAPSGSEMKVSGRTFEDLIKRSAEFARSVAYYGDDNHEDGNWTSFFEAVYDYEKRIVRKDVIDEMVRNSSVQPHLALMFAFFKMLLVEQEDFNRLTDRQMEFYFHDVLGFDMKKGSEGSVTVFAELAKNTESISIPKGFLFVAGKDASGQPVCYESVDELRLGKDEVAYIAKYNDMTGFVGISDKDQECTHYLYLASRLFCVNAESIVISIGEDDASSGLLHGLDVEYTSEDGWASAGKYEAGGLVIGSDSPKMSPFNKDTHGDGINTGYPAIRFVSKNGIGVLSAVSPMQLGKVRVVAENCQPACLVNKFGQFENNPGTNPFGYESHMDDWFEVVLPFSSNNYSLSVELNDSSVYDVPEQDCDRTKFKLKDSRCDQVAVSKEYSKSLLHIMKQETYDEELMNNALSSQMAAIIPRLLSPVVISKVEFSDAAPEIYFSHPCGWQNVADMFDSTANFKIGTGSAIYIALKNADLERGQISLHIRTNGKVSDPGNVQWNHMSSKGTWEEVSKSRIIRDTTSGLSQDGTVIFDCRERLTKGGKGLYDGYTWLRGVCDNDNCMEICDVRSRAVELVFSPSSKGAGPGGEALPKESICKSMESIVGLKKITQPFDGLRGSKEEAKDLYKRRVAETLRHKNRAWTVWDYESLILGSINDIAYVKCLPSCDGEGKPAPGSVTITVIPEVYDDELQPSAGVHIINEVRDTVKKVSSKFVNVNVVNPEYREIMVDVDITLRRNYNDSLRYETEISDALIEYLCSWKGNGIRPVFREGEGVSDIIAFLEALPFVDVVNDITVLIDGDKEVSMDGRIELDSPLEVITSAPAHIIRCKTAD